MRETTRRITLLAAALMLAGFTLVVSGCNTVQGIGEDVSAAGQTVADWAGDEPQN